MSSDFIIVSGEKKTLEPEDNFPNGLEEKWFSLVKGVSPKTVASLREKVLSKLETGAGQHLFSKMPPEYRFDAQLKHCVEEVIREQWGLLDSEERLLVRFPSVQAVGEHFETPKRGTGVIIQRELTPRFGVETVFQLSAGSFFSGNLLIEPSLMLCASLS